MAPFVTFINARECSSWSWRGALSIGECFSQGLAIAFFYCLGGRDFSLPTPCIHLAVTPSDCSPRGHEVLSGSARDCLPARQVMIISADCARTFTTFITVPPRFPLGLRFLCACDYKHEPLRERSFPSCGSPSNPVFAARAAFSPPKPCLLVSPCSSRSFLNAGADPI